MVMTKDRFENMRGKNFELLRPSMMFYDEQGLFYSILSENQSVLRTPDDILVIFTKT